MVIVRKACDVLPKRCSLLFLGYLPDARVGVIRRRGSRAEAVNATIAVSEASRRTACTGAFGRLRPLSYVRYDVLLMERVATSDENYLVAFSMKLPSNEVTKIWLRPSP